ncbi:hypothetical protein PRIPAC_79495, partial [Pristionchus pacificus]
SEPMRRLIPLLLTCLPSIISALEPSPAELLDSIALSEEYVQRFYPKAVENMNEKIRAYVAGVLPFDDICKGTYKPNLCTNKLRKPIEALMKSFTSLIDNQSRNETKEAIDSHCEFKKQLQQLASSKVLSQPPYLMANYTKTSNTTKLARLRSIDEISTTPISPNAALGDTLGQLRNTIELLNSMVSSNGLNGFNNPSELSDLLKKLNVFEAALNVSG